MKSKTMYNAIVVGAGSIGATKPDKFDSPKTDNVLTLAHAFFDHPQVNLIGIVDTDWQKAVDAAQKWRTVPSRDWREIKEPIDIMAVCVPTEKHIEICMQISSAANKPRIIMMEKPFCVTSEQCQVAIELLADAHIPIAVDYIRQYEPSVRAMNKSIESFGEIWSCVNHYDRGFQRDGSHSIALFNSLFGKFLGGTRIEGRCVDDYSIGDLSIPVYLRYERCGNVVMLPGNGAKWSVFEIDILFDNGRVRYIDHGLRIEKFRIEPEKTYGNYSALNYKPGIVKTDLGVSLTYYLKNCIDHLENGTPLLCSGNDALNVHHVQEHILFPGNMRTKITDLVIPKPRR